MCDQNREPIIRRSAVSYTCSTIYIYIAYVVDVWPEPGAHNEKERTTLNTVRELASSTRKILAWGRGYAWTNLSPEYAQIK